MAVSLLQEYASSMTSYSCEAHICRVYTCWTKCLRFTLTTNTWRIYSTELKEIEVIINQSSIQRFNPSYSSIRLIYPLWADKWSWTVMWLLPHGLRNKTSRMTLLTSMVWRRARLSRNIETVPWTYPSHINLSFCICNLHQLFNSDYVIWASLWYPSSSKPKFI